MLRLYLDNKQLIGYGNVSFFKTEENTLKNKCSRKSINYSKKARGSKNRINDKEEKRQRSFDEEFDYSASATPKKPFHGNASLN